MTETMTQTLKTLQYVKPLLNKQKVSLNDSRILLFHLIHEHNAYIRVEPGRLTNIHDHTTAKYIEECDGLCDKLNIQSPSRAIRYIVLNAITKLEIIKLLSAKSIPMDYYKTFIKNFTEDYTHDLHLCFFPDRYNATFHKTKFDSYKS